MLIDRTLKGLPQKFCILQQPLFNKFLQQIFTLFTFHFSILYNALLLPFPNPLNPPAQNNPIHQTPAV